MKTCPYCAEEIQDAAVKCRHCASELAGEPGPEELAAELGSAPAAASGATSAQVWATAGALVILAAVIGGGTSLYFHQQAEAARQREAQLRAALHGQGQELNPPLSVPRTQESVVQAPAEGQAPVGGEGGTTDETASAQAADETDIAAPRLLYKSTLRVPASSFREVLIGNAEHYGEIFGKFEAAKKQEVTVLAMNEADFFRYRGGAKVEGQRWTSAAEEFSFAPDGSSCFLVVQQGNAAAPASVSLEIYGRPRLEASRQPAQPPTP